MMPSIKLMLQKPYNEAVEDIEQKIEGAIHLTNSKNSKTQEILKNIIEYIIAESDEKHYITNMEIKDRIYDRYSMTLSNPTAGTIQRKLSGFIGYERPIEQKPRAAYYFRINVAEEFEKAYSKEPNYRSLKKIFLETLNQKT